MTSNHTSSELPAFDTREFLNAHIQTILAFYEPIVRDPVGGFHQTFRDDGSVYDAPLRHLVSSTRLVFNYAQAHRRHGQAHHRAWAEHGLAFLESAHRLPTGHYAWELRMDDRGTVTVTDDRAMAYGHAFVMLAAASALEAGIESARALIEQQWEFLEARFWEDGAYADERDGSLDTLNPYRGQNANMHMCEALIAAFNATGTERYLDRAEQLARRFAIELAAPDNGLIWEHYHSDWSIDWHYNEDKPDDLFKPWGFQPGHQVEWAKLLMQLHALRPADWLPEKAGHLFDSAMRHGWDSTHGGLVYGFAPDGSFCDAHKYFWVQSEAFAAAWRLYQHTGKQRYLDDYTRLWTWSWQYLVDHQHGAWFRIRERDGQAVDNLKSPPGKVDYHTLGACWDVLDQSQQNNSHNSTPSP